MALTIAAVAVGLVLAVVLIVRAWPRASRPTYWRHQ